MKRILLLGYTLAVSFSILKAQSCFNVAAGNDTVISCLQTCLDVKAKIPDVRTTDDYQVVSIPYQPFPFVNPGGVVFNPAYKDDSCSDVITLPFTFCFYGVNYTQCVVGTNGILTFELSNANTFNAWFLNLGILSNPGPVQPIPYPAGGTQNNPNTAYYPRACIMGPYHDIDPEFTQPQPPGRRMEYIVVGSAPCRKFILNFNDVPYFECASQLVTQQMVLYEGTGIIDIFIKSKPIACTRSTNEGRAILGIQNWNRDKAVAVNGRNNTVWSAFNEGWRFIPSGGTSLFKRVELHKNGNLIATGNITLLGTGELDVVFPNICQTENSADYVVKAFYKKCDNTLIETEGSDTIKVTKVSPAIHCTVTDARCFGSNGTITVTNPGAGNGVEFSINGGASWQTSTVFTKPAGTYTIQLRDRINNCSSSITKIITEPPLLKAVATPTIQTCEGNDGAISITASGGTQPYAYSINGGAVFFPGNKFTAAPGVYNNIIVKDTNGCTTGAGTTVNFVDQMFLTLGNDTAICQGCAFILQPQTNMQTNNFLWSPATFLDNNTIKNPLASPPAAVRYTLTATWGICRRTDDILINVYKGPAYYLPNAFTPNGDGLNDIFRPVPVGIVSTTYFSIYNRYGELVYKTTGWMQGWDGNFNGKKADKGSYVWMIKGIDKDGKQIEMKGSVMLIR